MPSPFQGDDKVVQSEPMVLEEAVEAAVRPEPLPWLTLETLLYGLIFGLALALRLGSLGAYPLSNAEAEQSLPALQLYRGGLLSSDQYSPLLISLQALTFLLFGASEVTARLPVVLLGSLLVFLPLTLRRQLGPAICLLASALLAISPTALFLSRTLNSEVGVAVGALMLVAGFFNWGEARQPRWLWLAAGGLALLLTSGPLAYSVLVVFGLIGLVKFSAFKALWLNGSAQPARWSQPPISSQLQRAGLFFLVALVLLATTATLNLKGFSVASSLFLDWLSRFSLQNRPEASFNAVFLLTIYEPLLVLAGLTGLAYAILQTNLVRLTLSGWFVGLLLLDVLMAGRPTGSVLLPLVPLAFLAALALAELWRGVRQWGNWGNEGLLLVAGLVIAVFVYIGLTGWLIRQCSPEDRICEYAWLQAVAALALFFIVVVFFAIMSQTGTAIRGAALAGVGVGLVVAIGIGWRLNYGPLMDLGYQPLAGIPASTELVALTETLANQSMEQVGDKTILDTALVGVNSPALQWRLRDYRHLTQANSLAEVPETNAIITPTNLELGLSEPYLGQSFTLDAVWSPVGLSPKELVNWLIYRRVGPTRPAGNQVVLWLRQPLPTTGR